MAIGQNTKSLPKSLREIAEARKRREQIQRWNNNLNNLPTTEDVEKWWSAPTQTLGSDLAHEEEKPQETSLTLEDDTEPDRATILRLIEVAADNHFRVCGVMPGQIRIAPFSIPVYGLKPYYTDFERNEIIPLVEDSNLSPNIVKCISHRKYFL